VYFVAQDLVSRHRLRRGQQFPEQTKQAVRGWASAFGEDERAEWSSFRFVETVLAPAAEAEAIVARGMTLDEARAFLATALEGR
jgi:hypothetical protein